MHMERDGRLGGNSKPKREDQLLPHSESGDGFSSRAQPEGDVRYPKAHSECRLPIAANQAVALADLPIVPRVGIVWALAQVTHMITSRYAALRV